MVFPDDPLDVRVTLALGGTPADVTDGVYLRDPVTISRGRPDEGARVDPSKCSLTFNNRSGQYSPRNPAGPYYGLIGRNTPVAVAVHTGAPALALDGDPANYASTPDHASLDITGDLDLRAEATIAWGLLGVNQILVSKWAPSQRSYSLRVRGGTLTLHWSTTGSDAHFAITALPLGLPARAAVRAALDTDDGAGGTRVRMYWAPSLAGPWELFLDDTAPGTTSVYAGTAPLLVAGSDPSASPPWVPFTGLGHRFEVRSGIGGTIVASPDFTAQAPGTTSFTDSAGRVWTLAGTAAITDRRARFAGEVSSWPARWDVSGRDVWTPVEASGILRRLGQGTKPLDSTLRRRIPSDPDLLAYWPMEDGEGATQAASPVAGVRPMAVAGAAFAADESLPGSRALPTLATGASVSGTVPRGTGGGWHVAMAYRIPGALPGPLTTLARVTVTGTGSAVRFVRVQASSSAIRILAEDADGAEVAHADFAGGLGDFTGDWGRLQIYAEDTGTQVQLYAWWIRIGTDASWFVTTHYTGDPGDVTAVEIPALAAAWDGMSIGHVGVFDTSTTGIYTSADHGFTGETALNRMIRLAAEEDYPLAALDGDPATDSEQVGPQRPAAVLDIIEAAADVDGGILFEDCGRLRLVYRDRHTLYNQRPALVLDYQGPGEVAPPLEPVDDDQQVHNDITVTREGGSSGRAVLAEGPLSVQAPPDGIGRYDESVTLALHDDTQPAQHAGWRLHLGTVDETRYPVVHVDLAAAPHLTDAVTSVDIGDRIQILNPPPWLPPGPIDLIVQGYTERIGAYDWDLEFTCTPAAPWNTAAVDDGTYGRADTEGSEFAAGLTATAVTAQVITPLGPRWTDSATYPADFPFLVRGGGEIMQVTACTPSIADAFGRTAASGWGTADSGQSWTTAGGSAADYSVTAGQGRHTCATTNVSRRTIVPAPGPDVDLYCRVTANALSTGGSQFAGPVARYTSGDNLYQLRVEFTTSGAVTLALRKRTSATETQLATYTGGLTHTAGAWLALRFQVAGTTLRGRIWDPATETEPLTWQVEAADADQASGDTGFRSIVATANTNTNPVLAFDDLANVRPQTMTLVRSVNGVVKPHPAGADLRLAHPAIVAL